MSHKIDDQFDFYPVIYSSDSNIIIPKEQNQHEPNYNVNIVTVQQKPNGTAQQYQYKLNEDFAVYGVYPKSFNNFTPKKPGQWIDFVYQNTEDLYLYIEINFSKFGTEDGINTQYSVASANLIVNQTLPDKDFSGSYEIATDKSGDKYYKIKMGRRLIAIFPYQKAPVIITPSPNGVFLNAGEPNGYINFFYKPFVKAGNF
jgi:hypothetical protein